MSKIGILTSGGDAPGMNACIRACVRTAIALGHIPIGIRRGYSGVINGDFYEMTSDDVSNIIHRGGTILGSARSEVFRTSQGRAKAYDMLLQNQINKLVVIGGDGSLSGAQIFAGEYKDLHIVGAPGTIDNDLYGTDYSIGFDTAINTAMEAIDKIKDTASSHDRIFIIEVMGRHSGYIALYTGISIGAEAILVPEFKGELDELVERIRHRHHNRKNSSIIVVAEGDETGGAFALSSNIQARFPGLDHRVTILGHVQRGGSPTAMERVRASKMGSACIQALDQERRNVMIGVVNQEVIETQFSKVLSMKHPVNPSFRQLVQLLS